MIDIAVNSLADITIPKVKGLPTFHPARTIRIDFRTCSMELSLPHLCQCHYSCYDVGGTQYY